MAALIVEFAASPIVKLAQTHLESLEGFGFRDLGSWWGLSFLLALERKSEEMIGLEVCVALVLVLRLMRALGRGGGGGGVFCWWSQDSWS